MAETEPMAARQEIANDKEPMHQLGELLKKRGQLTSLQLEFALQKQKVEGRRLGNLLIHHGLASEHQIAKIIAEQRGIPFLEANLTPVPEVSVLDLFNRDLCLTQGFLPLRRAEGGIEVLIGDGDVTQVAEIVSRRSGLRAIFFQGDFTYVTQAIRLHFYFARNPVEEQIEREVRRLNDDPDHAYSPERLLDLLLHLAVRERATDIHIAPAERSLHVLLRIDGVLRPLFALPAGVARILAYIKLSAEMDVTEQRLPQDGSFHATVLDMPYAVRVSTLVSIHGERMVLRLLPGKADLNGLEELGFLPRDVRHLQHAFSRPSGIVLVTGPTGSGKSTTLHAALRMQSLIERNVLTIEEPVEYRVPGAGQTEVNRKAGYEFSTAMRHFLRHDPDVILVGEIRDGETAQMAIDAASTGHLVLSTLHVGLALGAVSRLRLLDVDAESVAENLVAVVNQRLIRQNCPFCSVETPFSEEERRFLKDPAQTSGKRGTGCDHCRGTGYHGRLPVYEILSVDRALADAIANDEPVQTVRRLAAEAGFQPILEMARERVLAGQTTVEEVLRVVGSGFE